MAADGPDSWSAPVPLMPFMLPSHPPYGLGQYYLRYALRKEQSFAEIIASLPDPVSKPAVCDVTRQQLLLTN